MARIMPRSSIVFTEQEEIMKPRRANITSWLCASLCIAGIVCTAAAQENKSLDQELAASRVAIQKQQYDEAIRLLNEALTRFPGNRELRVELGRVYVYDHRDEQAMKLFREVLREDPSDRAAKLQLARALGYRRDYSASNKFYRELLAAKPEDEASSLGITRNLTYQRKTAEARQEVARALAIHPNSLRLQEYKRRLSEGRSVAGNRNREEPIPAGTRKEARLPNTTDYFSDSIGNRSLRASQLFEHQITPAISNRVQAEERSLWTNQGQRANVFSGTDEIRVQVNHSLEVGAGGGTVRFADGVHRVLYRGTLLSHPSKYLWLEGGFSRFPIYPTYRAAQFDLLAEGWRGRVDWQPGRGRSNVTRTGIAHNEKRLKCCVGWAALRCLSGPATVSRMPPLNNISFTAISVPAFIKATLGNSAASFDLGKSFQGYTLAAGARRPSGEGQTTWLGRSPCGTARGLAIGS